MTFEQTIEEFVERLEEARSHLDRALGSLEVAAELVYSSDQWKLLAVQRDLRKLDGEVRDLGVRAYERLPKGVA